MHPKGAYFTRGSGHNKFGGYTEDADEYQEVVDRLDRKIQRAAQRGAGAGHQDGSRAPSSGSSRSAAATRPCVEALDLLARATASRSTTCASAASRSATRCARSSRRTTINFVVEQNRDAQLRSLLMLETGVPVEKLRIGALLRRLPDERASRDRRREGEAGAGGMTYIAKPKVHHPALQKNALGLTRRDYEGAMSTLCAGCGHDSITAAIIQAFWELSIAAAHASPSCRASAARRRRRPTSCARRTASTACTAACRRSSTGANAANRDLIYIGISGDGDSLSIGLGQLCHAIRRNVNMLYVLENNGVYGLTKGQFSASADVGSMSKKGEANTMQAIDGACSR